MKLGVNIDHVATLRQARRAQFPNPVKAAQICEQAGCHSIVCHLREDRRHINDSDLRTLRQIVRTKLNLEMSCAQEIVKIALKTKPDQATLVPERRLEITTEGGLDVAREQRKIKQVVESLSAKGIRVSLFIDPQKEQIEAAKDTGAQCIELHTGKYANATRKQAREEELQNIRQGAELARKLGLNVFAGHGLNYQNVKAIAQLQEITELNIGHAIIAQALFVGLENAVKEMLSLLS